jgi:hypothetical protein
MIYAPDPIWGYLPKPVDPWAIAPTPLSPVRWFG